MNTGLGLAVTVDNTALQKLSRFAKVFPNNVDNCVRKATDFAYREIIRRTPVKTGDLRKSFIKKPLGKFSYGIVSELGRGRNYSIFVEKGTGYYSEHPHPIVPKNAKMLVFPILRGNKIVKWIRTKSTKGMHGKFMVHRSISPTVTRLTDLLRKEIRDMWGD
ncbi:MAG: HK97 gp10 family phage protein [candidate division WOR-3 bacterium]